VNVRRAVRFTDPTGDIRLGRLEKEVVVDAAPSPQVGFDASAEAWSLIEDARGPVFDLSDIRLLAPVVPRYVLCVGSNYRDHIEETQVDPPTHPQIFVKLGSAVVGPDADIVLPLDEPKTDWEAELAIVIGRSTRRAKGVAARRAIGGITAINDVSGRAAQLETGMGQFTRGKSFDTFAPLGPCVVHPEDLSPDSLAVELRLNGDVLQASNSRHLVFDCVTLVEWISAAATLSAGDVIATGTPGGVGHAMVPPRYLTDGDVVEVVLEGVGTLRNSVRQEQPPLGVTIS
jgi:2-keto-4-pentenoate hydratase/2-oxohepta-3-ene-1,7-dioic acid hydratase in catechol pathway